MLLDKEANTGYWKQTDLWINDFIYSTQVFWTSMVSQALRSVLIRNWQAWMAQWKCVECSRSCKKKRDESWENGRKELSVWTVGGMTNIGLPQRDNNVISSPSPCKILYLNNGFSTPKHAEGSSPPTVSTPTCDYRLTTKYFTVLHIPEWHCWLSIYLDEGLFSYIERSSIGGSLRWEREKSIKAY